MKLKPSLILLQNQYLKKQGLAEGKSQSEITAVAKKLGLISGYKAFTELTKEKQTRLLKAYRKAEKKRQKRP